MKGALLFSNNSSFTDWAFLVLKDAGYTVFHRNETLQIRDSGRLMLICADKESDGNWSNLSDELLSERQMLKGMDFSYLIDCRWEDLFCRVIRSLGEQAPDSFRIVDNASRVFRPEEVDPAKIAL
jgi:hypothetical protein